MVAIPEFHHSDVPPQQWLDELHSFNIPRAWDVQIANTQRVNLAARNIEQIKNWRIALNDQMKKIAGRYDSDNRHKQERMLAPYKLLDNLALDLYKQLQDLDSRAKAGRAIPMGFEFGKNIFGDLATQRWHLGSQQDEYRWRDFLSVEQRYQTLTKEYKNQSRGYDNAKQRINETKSELESLQQQLAMRSGLSQISLQILIVMTIVLFCLMLGISAQIAPLPIDNISQNVFAAIMLVLAIVGAVIAYQLARRRRFAIAQLEEDITDMQIMLEEITKEAKRQRQYLLPTRQTVKEVKLEYEELKASFA